MLVRMAKTQKGSQGNGKIDTFEAGKEYDISEFLYRQFENLGVLAAAAKLPDVDQEPKQKEKPPHPNKMNKRGRKTKG